MSTKNLEQTINLIVKIRTFFPKCKKKTILVIYYFLHQNATRDIVLCTFMNKLVYILQKT